MCRSSEPKWCKSDVYMLCGSQDGAVLLIPSCKASCLVETYLVEDIQLYFEDHATYKGYVAEIIGMCRSSVPKWCESGVYTVGGVQNTAKFRPIIESKTWSTFSNTIQCLRQLRQLKSGVCVAGGS